jgi:hypothetical protein
VNRWRPPLGREAGAFIGRRRKVLQTEDLFLGALGLSRGGELIGIDVRCVNGRSMAIFRIAGPAMEEIEREYYHGRVLVNLRMLKAEVARLKNVAFDALRKEESRDERVERNVYRVVRK